MTVEQLKERLSKIPKDYLVLLESDKLDEWKTVRADYIEVHKVGKYIVICDENH